MFKNLEVIDCELHEWYVSPELLNIVGDNPHVAMEITKTAMDAAGVDAVVMPWHHQMALYAISRHPDRFACLRSAPRELDPSEPDIDNIVANLRRERGVLGLRAIISVPRDGTQVRRFQAGEW